MITSDKVEQETFLFHSSLQSKRILVQPESLPSRSESLQPTQGCVSSQSGAPRSILASWPGRFPNCVQSISLVWLKTDKIPTLFST